MGSADVLRIMTAVDVGPLQAGMNQAAAIVQASTDRMATNFKQLQGSSTLWLPSGMASEINASRDVAVNAVEEIGKRSNASATEARHAIRGLGEEIGVHMPRFVSSFLTTLGPVAGIMAAAFAPIAIIGVVQVLAQIPKAINEGVNALSGWDEEAKTKFKEEETTINSTREAFDKYRNAILGAQAVAGKTGTVKTAAELDDIQRHLNEANAAWNKNSAEIAELEKRLRVLSATQTKADQLIKSGGDEDQAAFNAMRDSVIHYTTAMFKSSEEADKAKIKVEALKEEQKKLKTTIDELVTQQAIKPIDQGAELKKQSEALIAARIDADQKTALAHIAAKKSEAEEDYRTNKLSLSQYTIAVEAAENDRFRIEQNSITRRKALAEQKAKSGTDAGPDLAKLNADSEALTAAHEAALYGIRAKYAEETKKIHDATTIAEIEGQKKVALESIAYAEQTAKAQYDEGLITSNQLSSMMASAENRRYEVEHAALVRRLELAKQEPEKKSAEMETLNRDIEALEIKHQATMSAIDSAQRIKDISDERIALELELQEEMKVNDLKLKEAQTIADKRVNAGKISSGEWLKEEKKSLDDWYREATRIADAEIAYAEKNREKDLKAYQAAIEKKKQIDAGYHKKEEDLDAASEIKMSATLERRTKDFNANVLKWAQGQQSFAAMWGNTWNAMASQMIMAIIRGTEAEIAAAITQKALDKGTITAKAATAAAKSYDAMAGIPIVGPVLGGIAAGATFAAIMALGSFREGGVLDSDMMMIGHAKEMMLPANISTGLQNLIKNGGSTGGGKQSVHMNYHPTVIGEDRWAKKLFKQHSDSFSKEIKRQMRNGAIPGYGL